MKVKLALSARMRRFLAVLCMLALALLPHSTQLPLWVLCTIFVLALWRLFIEYHNKPLPSRGLRVVLAVSGLISVLFYFHTLNGLEAGTALLSVMAGMKLLETRGIRDETILVFLAYFLVFAALLHEQNLLKLPYLLLTVWASTALLLNLHTGIIPLPYMRALRLTGVMLLQALPLAIALFIFIPRLPGQIWTLSTTEARSGLSDEMHPGDVAKLSLSDAIAFRVHFDGASPPPTQLYWRAIVLQQFDGRTWRRASEKTLAPHDQVTTGTRYDYRVILEAHQQRWLPALEFPTQWPTASAQLTSALTLTTTTPISTTTTFTLQSNPRYQNLTLTQQALRLNTTLSQHNPRSRTLAQTLYAKAGSDREYIQALLNMFHEQNYYYTLEPPRLQGDAVDDFLFNSRRGFCEHYASAFTVLARAAGIPARVVTGYQGGEFNPVGEYFIVRQADAHAWSEVWLKDQGWVRYDPTAAIAPEHIEQDARDTILHHTRNHEGSFWDPRWLHHLQLTWDALNAYWYTHVIDYDAVTQRKLMRWLGFIDVNWRSFVGVLFALLVLSFIGMIGYLAWRFRPQTQDPTAAAYALLKRKLNHSGLSFAPHEGPDTLLRRAQHNQPATTAQALDTIRQTYIALRYEHQPSAQQVKQLRQQIKCLQLAKTPLAPLK